MTTRPVFVQIVTVPLSLMFSIGHAALLSAVGFEMHAISSPGREADRYAEEEGVPFHPVAMARQIAPLKDVWSLIRLIVILRRLRPAVVNAGTPKAGVLGTVAAWLLGVPTRIYCVHGLPLLTATGVRRVILVLSERIACAAATQVVCVSPSIRDALLERSLCAPEKAFVIGNGSSNGIDTVTFNPMNIAEGTRGDMRRRAGISADAPVIGFIGRLAREKGVEELWHAWDRVRAHPSGPHLLVIGPSEPNDAVSPTVMARLSEDPRVHLVGADWHPLPWYAAMDVFCLPSHREGCPNVLLEAAAMELPIVAFRVPGVCDTVSDDETGSLVTPHSVEGLAEALVRYLNDHALRTRHGVAGRRHVIALYERRSVWRHLTKFYSTLDYCGGPHCPQTASRAADAFRS